MQFFINGKIFKTDFKTISHKKIIKLLGYRADTVLFYFGVNNAKGQLLSGQRIKVKNNMVFNVASTNNA